MSDIRFQIKNGFNAANGALTVNTSTKRIGTNTHAPLVTWEVNATDAVKLPVGNTVNRPVGIPGYLRYNSDLGSFEGYTSTGWGPIAGALNGSNTQVIINDSGSSAGFPTLTFDKTSGTLNVGGTFINSSIVQIGVVSSNTTALAIGNTVANTTSIKVGLNTTITSGQIALGGTSSINATFYTGTSNTATFANTAGSAATATNATTANTATTATTATNATNATNASNLNGQSSSYYLARSNHNGNLPSNVMSGTDQYAAHFLATSYLYSYGDVYAQGNVYAYYSDKRLKTGFAKIKNALSKVSSLTGYHYKQNRLGAKLGFKDNRPQVGLIAQEVQEVLPEAVALAAFDRNDDGTSKSGENYLTISYDKLIPLLVEAIKELKIKVEKLEKR